MEKHALRKEALSYFYDQELTNLIRWVTQQKLKDKGYKELYTDLVYLKDKQRIKKALLDEYFNMYKLIFQIRTISTYNWQLGTESRVRVKDLYVNDQTFAKMIRQVQQCVINLFEGTDKYHTAMRLASKSKVIGPAPKISHAPEQE